MYSEVAGFFYGRIVSDYVEICRAICVEFLPFSCYHIFTNYLHFRKLQ